MSRDKVASIITWLILVLVMVCVIGLLGAVEVAILMVVGIEYESLKSLIIFVVGLFLLSIPIDIFATALPKALYEVGIIRKESINLILYPLDFWGNMAAISIVDYFMDSVKLSLISACIFSLMLCIMSYLLDNHEA